MWKLYKTQYFIISLIPYGNFVEGLPAIRFASLRGGAGVWRQRRKRRAKRVTILNIMLLRIT
jgi:hypothetical protein